MGIMVVAIGALVIYSLVSEMLRVKYDLYIIKK